MYACDGVCACNALHVYNANYTAFKRKPEWRLYIYFYFLICCALTEAPAAALFTTPGKSGQKSNIVIAITSVFPFLHMCILCIGTVKRDSCILIQS